MRINKEIVRLAVPNIISGITIPLIGAVSLAMMGQLNSLVYKGALSVGSMIFNFLYWTFGFLRMGTTGFTAQAFGRALGIAAETPQRAQRARSWSGKPDPAERAASVASVALATSVAASTSVASTKFAPFSRGNAQIIEILARGLLI